MNRIVNEDTTMSSKGQVVLPKIIRENLSLKSGTKLMVFADGNNILLKPIKAPRKEEFASLIKAADDWMADTGKTIRKSRNRKRK